jgi:hypothetical protein
MRGVYHKRLTPEEETEQRHIAFAAIRRLYAELLPLWRSCPRGFCRRHHCCNGDVRQCLARAWPLTPPAVQQKASEQVAVGGPRHLPPATHLEGQLRSYPASNFVH